MKLSHFCIRRPVFTIVLSLILIVIGIIGFLRLTVRQYPNVSFPVITIVTNYPGANANLVESSITTPIEDTLTNIDGLKAIESTSSQNGSTVRLKFDLGTNLDVAASQVRDKLATVTNTLPDKAKQPVIYRMDTSEWETVVLSVSDSQMAPMALTDYINRYIKPRLEQVDGVSRIEVFGGREYAMRLWLDPAKMAAHNVTTSNVVNSIIVQNQDVSSGMIKTKKRYYSIITKSKLHTAQEFNNIIIKEDNGYLVRFKDIGHAVLAPEDEDSAVHADGKNVIGVGVLTKSNANEISVAANSIKKIAEIQKTLPQGMQIKVAFNNAAFVRASLNNVYEAIFIAVALVILVVFLFLGSLRATLIPIATIPICLIAVFGFIYFLGYSINEITLLALVLAIGLVVDDAIVMLENIHRYLENGQNAFTGALYGSKQIGFAIVAMTITLAAVYAPIAFTPGMIGILFRQFAAALAIAVLISGFVALTLSPMMCARILGTSNTKYSLWIDKLFIAFVNGYQKLLRIVIVKRRVVIIVLLLILVSGYGLYKSFASEISPPEDSGVMFALVTPPDGSSFAYLNNYSKQLEKILMAVPEVTNYMAVLDGPDEARIFAMLKPWQKRKRSQQQIAAAVNKKFANIAGVRATVINRSGLGGGGKHGDAVQFVLMTTQDYSWLNKVATKITKLAGKWHGFGEIDSSLKMNSEQFEITINRSLAAQSGVNMDDIAKTLATMVGGNEVSEFSRGGKDYYVILQLPLKQREMIATVKNLYVRNNAGKMIPLSGLIAIHNSIGPLTLPHYDRLRAAKITAQLRAGYTMSDGVNFVRTMLAQNLPKDASYVFAGATERYLESSHRMAMIFSLALVFIFLVLAAQFESFIDPFIILFTVPLAIVGAMLTLKIVGGTLNIFSEIGFVTLIGLITKHGILITEFANQLRAEGKDLQEAIITAAGLRIRPILMTTAAMVLGALPLALASGAGAFIRQQIGWVIVGGLLFGTFFSLFVVPVAYSYFGRYRFMQ